MNSLSLTPEQSDIDLGIDLSKIKSESTQDAGLQGTAAWRKQRNGQYNASEAKKLMTCDQKYAKASWHNPDKYLAFSDGALKYIFKKAKERETGRVLESAQTNDMKYGSIIENLTFRRADELLRSQGLYLEKVGYKKLDDIPTAGASSDAVVRRISDNVMIASAEMKACVSWESLYERTFEATDEKSIDFWQTQLQMLAWNVEQTYYLVISPPSDIKKYIYAEDVEFLYEEWCSETEMEIELIERSEIHTNNLKKRISIAERTIEKYLATKENIKGILYEIIDEEKNIPADRPEELEEKSEFEKAIEEVAVKEQTVVEIFDEIVDAVLTPAPKTLSDEDLDDLPF